ncbi:hypothetical protein AYO22_00444 [Fonsecaea multimorphosa]|nr:hypothetical protein AYO22_00444 [Fonsecaea multimorphosa]
MSNPTKSTITTTTTTARSRQTPSQPSVTSSEPDAAQVQAILATIRANLLLVARTWGRESRQHREARGVMRAYLEENVLRHRVENRHRQRHVEDTDDGSHYTAKRSRAEPAKTNIALCNCSVFDEAAEENCPSKGLPPPLSPPDSGEFDVLLDETVDEVLEPLVEDDVDVRVEVAVSIEVSVEVVVEVDFLVLSELLVLVVLLADPVLLKEVVIVDACEDVPVVLVAGGEVSVAMLIDVSKDVDVEVCVASVVPCGVVAVVAPPLPLSAHRKLTTFPTKSCPIKELPSACSPAQNRCTNFCDASRLDSQPLEQVPVPPMP